MGFDDEEMLPVSDHERDARGQDTPGPVLMELCISPESADVIVRDSDPTVPAALAPDPGRIGQHGMEIVRAVTTGLFVEQEPIGKRITTRMP
ncbi:ATP-binding protein [Streptomyces sp. NPDC001809]